MPRAKKPVEKKPKAKPKAKAKAPAKATRPRGGRPEYQVTKELLDKVESLAAQGLTEKQICDCIGWSQETLIQKKKSYSELSEAIKRGKSKGLALVTQSLIANAKAGNVTAQIFFLKNRDPDNWKDRRDNTLSDPNGNSIPITHIELVAPEIDSNDE